MDKMGQPFFDIIYYFSDTQEQKNAKLLLIAKIIVLHLRSV